MVLFNHPFFKSNDFKRLFENVVNFSFLQVTNYIVPLITIPYIVRIIGPEKFGIITFAQAVIAYMMICVDYGFNISATSKIAKYQTNQAKINEIYNSVFFARLLIMLGMAFLLFILAQIWQEINEHLLIYIFSFVIIPGNMLLSPWFFTGLEKIKYLNAINIIYRVLYAVLIFTFITEKDHFYLIPAFNSGSVFLGGIVSTFVTFFKFKTKIQIPGKDELFAYFKEGWHVFFANFSINMYRNANIIILGFFAPKEIVGIYGAGEKLIKALQEMFTPITNTIFPFISRKMEENRKKSITALKWVATIMGSTTFLFSTIIFFNSESLTLLILGENFMRSAIVVKICSYVIFFGILNYISGIIFMINFSMDKEFMRAVMLTGLLSILICAVSTYVFMEIGTAVTFIFSEIFLLIFLIKTIYTKQSKWRTSVV